MQVTSDERRMTSSTAPKTSANLRAAVVRRAEKRCRRGAEEETQRRKKCGSFFVSSGSICVCVSVLTVIFCWLFVVTAVAQTPVTVTLDRTTLTTDDQLRVGVTIDGQINDLPTPPDFDGFNFLGRTQSSQTTIINGDMQSLITVIYTLRPVLTGTLTIGAFEMIVDGIPITTEPQTVAVTQGTQSVPSANIAAPSALTGAESVYAEAFVDVETPWLGEQVVYTFRFFRATDRLMNANYEPPEFVGFWHDDEEERTTYLSDVGGREYQVTEFRRYIFPTIAGELTIEPTLFIINDSIDVKTAAVTLQVNPLPEPAPDGFNGAIGTYTLEATLDKAVTNVDDPVALTVRLRGEGNFDITPDPEFSDLPGWRAIEQQSVTNTQFQNGVLVGQRQWERLLIPTEPGELTIPGIDYIYFDPATEQYETTTSSAYTVIVGGEAGEINTPALTLTNPAAPTLRPILAAPSLLEKATQALPDQSFFWLLWLLPLLIVLGDGAAWLAGRFIRPRTRRTQTQTTIIASQPRHPDRYVDGWLEKRYGMPFTGLTHHQRIAALRETGLSAATLTQIDTFYRTAEATRYAGTDTPNIDPDTLIQTIEAEETK